jgi:hypothetical protein
MQLPFFAVVRLSGFVTAALIAPEIVRCEQADGVPIPPQVATFKGDDAFDVLAVGPAVFVYRRESLPTEQEAVKDEVRMIARERAGQHGVPPPEIEALASLALGSDQYPSFSQAEIATIERSGLLWKLRWEWIPTRGGGSTGVPWIYRSYVRPDGSRIEPDRVLCSVRHVAEHDRNIVSRLAFADFAARPDARKILHGDQVQAVAREHLAAFLRKEFPERTPAYRFRNQQMVDVPIATRNSGKLDSRTVWEVNFVEASLEGRAILEASSFVIWVTSDGRAAELSIDGWSLDSSP